MKNKIYIGILIFIAVLVSYNVKTYAATLNPDTYATVFWVIPPYASSLPSIYCSYNNDAFTIYDTGYNLYMTPNRTYYSYFPSSVGSFNYSTSDVGASKNFVYGTKFVVYKGNVSISTDKGELYDSVVDYEESLIPSWYESMWDTFKDYFTNPVPFQWFKNLIDKVFGDDNNGGTISDNVTLGNPTLAPTPTPIPYTTVVIPKTDVNTGDTYYETNYYYVNPSGTPIITSSPPVNSPTNNGGGNGRTEYSPLNGQPYSIPRLDWLSSVDIDGTGYDGIDSIGDGMSSIDDIGSEYTDGMSTVQDATGTLPSNWLLLIGIVAAIPLLAGIVSRFLGG